MSQTLSAPLQKSQSPGRSFAFPIPVLVAVVVLALAHLPILTRHLHNLYLKPHYEFAPLVFIGAAVLAWPAIRMIRAGHRPGATEWQIGLGLLVLNWLILTVAVVLDSPWLGMVSFWELLAAMALLAGGKHVLRATVPALIFLLLVVPPPMNLDGKLVLGLQGLTSRISSHILNRLGTLHFLDGNTFEVGGKSYFVDKACSGINSLFSTIAVTLFCVLYFGAHWVRTVCLFLAVVFWVVVANVTRVTSIVWLDRRFNIDLSREQWDWAKGVTWTVPVFNYDIDIGHLVPGPHALFGFLLFGLVLAMMFSTNRFLMFLGTTIRWGQRAPILPDDEPTPTGGEAARHVGWGLVAPALCAYGVLFIFQAGEIQLGALGTESSLVKYYNEWDKSYLPETIGAGWVQGDSNFEKRDSGNPYGAHSRTWQYRNIKNSLVGVVSFDYPFPEWHDLRYCYTSAGWVMDKTDTFDVRTAPDARMECVRFDLRKPFEQREYVWFTEFDQVGRPIQIRLPDLSKTYTQVRWDERFTAVRDRWLSLFGKATAPPSFMDVLQVQLMVNHPGPLSQDQKDQAQQFFEQAAELIRRKCVAGLPGRPQS